MKTFETLYTCEVCAQPLDRVDAVWWTCPTCHRLYLIGRFERAEPHEPFPAERPSPNDARIPSRVKGFNSLS